MSNDEVTDTGIDIDGEKFVNVQVGNTLFRDGGPYADQSDAIRDEKINAAREGRAPNFDNLIPTQYKVAPVKDVEKQTHVVESQRTNYEQTEITIGETAPYEKPVKDRKPKTIKLSDSDKAQSDSEVISRATLANVPAVESKDSDSGDII